MVVLRTTETSGASFIRTDQLDGETDWKLRRALPPTQALARDEDLLQLEGFVYGAYATPIDPHIHTRSEFDLDERY